MPTSVPSCDGVVGNKDLMIFYSGVQPCLSEDQDIRILGVSNSTELE